MLGRRTTIATILASALTAALSGCGATVDVPEAPPGATRGPIAARATGRLAVVAGALGDVPLLPAQRAEIEKLASEADARHASLAATRRLGLDALAGQVEAGRLDRAALQPAIDSYADAWARTRIGDRTAVERLHAVLDAGQRSLAVDAMMERLDERKKRSRSGRLAAVAAELELTPEQIDGLRGVLPSARERKHGERKDGGRRRRLDEMVESFAADDFSLAGTPTFDDLRAKAGRKAERIVGKVEGALPILTERQRKLAAAKIRAHAGDAD